MRKKSFLSRGISLALAGALVLTLAPAGGARAAQKDTAIHTMEEDEYDFDTHTTGDFEWGYKDYTVGDEIEITGYTGRDENVVVPATLDGKKVVKLGYSLFYDWSGSNDYSFIKSIEISEGIETIESNSSRSLKNLEYIKFPTTFKKLQGHSFAFSGLKAVGFNRGLERIESSAFTGNSNLTSVSVPDSVTYVHADAFSDTGLQYVFYIAGRGWKPETIEEQYSNLYKSASVLYVNTEYSSVSYNNRAKEPAVTVRTADGTEIDASNYTVSYADNRKVGQAIARVTFKESSEYAGAVAYVPFMITEPDPSALAITPYEYRFTDKQTVTITTGNADARIVYTTDGSEPTKDSAVYTEPFEIESTTTVKAAELINDEVGESVSATYTKSEIYQIEGTYKAVATMDKLSFNKLNNHGFEACIKDTADVEVVEQADGSLIYYVTYTFTEGTPAEDSSWHGIKEVWNGQDVESMTYRIKEDADNHPAEMVYDNPLGGIRKYRAEYKSLPDGVSLDLKISQGYEQPVPYVHIDGSTFVKTSESEVDAGELESTIKGAQTVLESGIHYTKETTSALKTALDEAQGVAGDLDAAQEQADAAVAALVRAYSELKLAGPVISPKSSIFDGELGEITITPSNEGAKIYYEASEYYCPDPTKESTEYTEPISVDEGTQSYTVKAIEVLDGEVSEITEKTWSKRKEYEVAGTYSTYIGIRDFPFFGNSYVESLIARTGKVTVREDENGDIVYDVILTLKAVDDSGLPSQLSSYTGWTGQKVTGIRYVDKAVAGQYEYNKEAEPEGDNELAGLRRFKLTFKNFPGVDADDSESSGLGNKMILEFDGSDSEELSGDNEPGGYLTLFNDDQEKIDLHVPSADDDDYPDDSELEATIKGTEAVDVSAYNQTTSGAFLDALADAKEKKSDLGLTQEQADEAVAALLEAYRALSTEPDPAETTDTPAAKDNEVIFGSGNAATALEINKKYQVPVRLMNSSKVNLAADDYFTNQENLSMSAACLKDTAQVEAGKDKSYITLNLGSIEAYGTVAWATRWYYYEDFNNGNGEMKDVEVIETDTETGNPTKVRFEIPQASIGQNGIYVAMEAGQGHGARSAVVVIDWKNATAVEQQADPGEDPSKEPASTKEPVAPSGEDPKNPSDTVQPTKIPAGTEEPGRTDTPASATATPIPAAATETPAPAAAGTSTADSTRIQTRTSSDGKTTTTQETTNGKTTITVTNKTNGTQTYTVSSKGVTVSKVKTSKKSATIPASVKGADNKTYKVTSIAKNALKGNKKLTSVTIGVNVKTIGASAFQGDSKLKTVKIKSKQITKIGKSAFKGINKNAVFKIAGTKKYFKTLKKKIKKSGTVKNASYKRQ